MTVQVRYFAVLRDQRGVDRETIEVPAMTARQFAHHLIDLHSFTLPSSLVRVAVNGQFVDDDYAISDGEEVVLIPPVAGG